jgi:hypothetical protein
MFGGLDFTRLIAREICDPMESERGIVAEYLDPVAFAALELLESLPLPGCGSERADANDRFWLVEDLEEPIIAESLIDK